MVFRDGKFPVLSVNNVNVEVKPMLRKLLESTLGPMTNIEFEQTIDLATADIQINRVAFGKRTSLKDVVEIADHCFTAAGRGRVA